MKYFAVYDTDGRILRSGRCRDEDLVLQASVAGEWVIETIDTVSGEAYYVLAGALTPRPPPSIVCTFVGRVITLTGAQVGSRVIIGGPATAAPTFDDPAGLAITVPVAGLYTVTAENFPALKFSGTCNIL